MQLAFFSANALPDSILVRWETVSEINNAGFNVYRSDSPAGQKTRLNFGLIPSKAPGSPLGFPYSYMDSTARAGRTYYYWLEDLSLGGWYTMHGPVAAALRARGRRPPATASA